MLFSVVVFVRVLVVTSDVIIFFFPFSLVSSVLSCVLFSRFSDFHDHDDIIFCPLFFENFFHAAEEKKETKREKKEEF